MLGNPNDRDFLGMVCAQVIPNCPFNVDDCKHAAQIFGKNLPDVLGKTEGIVRVGYARVHIYTKGYY